LVVIVFECVLGSYFKGIPLVAEQEKLN